VNKTSQSSSGRKSGLHSRNKNNDRYDFPSLISSFPELAQFVFVNKYKKETIDFSNPSAVRTLNKVLLHHHYGITFWELPQEHLCPPIPGRADYIHHLADLIALNNNGIIPQGNCVSVLDIGVGANCIYPLIGHAEYGWRFVGSDVDPSATKSAQHILDGNGISTDHIEIRTQQQSDHFFQGLINPRECFDLTMCNPPFHSSIDQATSGTRRKWKNLGNKTTGQYALNFGGRFHELVYPGGEIEFVKGLVHESAAFAKDVLWFTSLISKQSNLLLIKKELIQIHAVDVRTIDMAQGQKKSRFIAWTFHTEQERKYWQEIRWSHTVGSE